MASFGHGNVLLTGLAHCPPSYQQQKRLFSLEKDILLWIDESDQIVEVIELLGLT